LHPPQGLPVRPTTDFAKTALFNILANRIDFEETSLLDLFAGTGSITLEFASRGCQRILAVDSNSGCLKFIKETSFKLQISGITTFKTDAFLFLKTAVGNYDFIFADPPYDLENLAEIPDAVFDSKLLLPDGIFVLEHPARTDFSTHPRFSEHRAYGKVNFSFFE
jgi:16S rRNA (guanine(966)-N(2))-methyltransferase RsmD